MWADNNTRGEQPGALPSGERLVFLVGAPRSGTTWLQRLLVSHPRIHSGQESHLFSKFLGPNLRMWREQLSRVRDESAAAGRVVGLPCYLSDEDYVGMLRSHLGDLLEKIAGDVVAGELFIEKTPDHALFVPEIRELLPRSRIIHLLRDPRDVVASMLAASSGWGSWWAPADPASAARSWLAHVHGVRRAAAAIPDTEYLELRYEELAAAPVRQLQRVLRFLDMELPDLEAEAVVDANRPDALRSGSGTPIELRGEAARRWGSAVPDPPEFVRAGREGGWRADLSLIDRAHVWRIVRHELADCGYQWPLTDWLPGPHRSRAWRSRLTNTMPNPRSGPAA